MSDHVSGAAYTPPVRTEIEPLFARVTKILRDARVAGGWIDEDVAQLVIAEFHAETPEGSFW